MDYLNAFSISGAGLVAERLRVEVASLNIASASGASTASGAYRPLRVVHAGAGSPAFRAPRAGFTHELYEAAGAPSVVVEQAARAPRPVHEPGHPLADGDGFIYFPAVDLTSEMMSLMTATRAYEANVAALNVARTLATKALDIGA